MNFSRPWRTNCATRWRPFEPACKHWAGREGRTLPPEYGPSWSGSLRRWCRLIDDLLDVSRISSGKVVLQRCRVDLRAIAELAIEASLPFIAAGHHEFKADLPDGPVWVDGDASRLSQVMINLLNNAAKYTAEGGKIRLILAIDEIAGGRAGERQRRRDPA